MVSLTPWNRSKRRVGKDEDETNLEALQPKMTKDLDISETNIQNAIRQLGLCQPDEKQTRKPIMTPQQTEGQVYYSLLSQEDLEWRPNTQSPQWLLPLLPPILLSKHPAPVIIASWWQVNATSLGESRHEVKRQQLLQPSQERGQARAGGQWSWRQSRLPARLCSGTQSLDRPDMVLQEPLEEI